MHHVARNHRLFIRAICLLLVTGIVGCQADGIVHAFEDRIPLPTQRKIAEMVRVIEQANADLILEQARAARALGKHMDDEFEMDPQDELELQNFYASPQPYLEGVYHEEVQGPQKIDLLHAIYTAQPYDVVREEIANFVTPAELSELDAQVHAVGGAASYYEAEAMGKAGMIDYDKRLHVLAGAAVALVVTGFVYVRVPWWRPVAKISVLAAWGLGSGLVAAGLKEICDASGTCPRSTSESSDFAYTMAAAGAGTAFSVFTVTMARALGISRTLTAAFIMVTGVVVGREPAVAFVRRYFL